MSSDEESTGNDDAPVTQGQFREAMEGIDDRFGGVDAELRKMNTTLHELHKSGIRQEHALHKLDLVLEFVSPLKARLDGHENRLETVEDQVAVLAAGAKQKPRK